MTVPRVVLLVVVVAAAVVGCASEKASSSSRSSDRSAGQESRESAVASAEPGARPQERPVAPSRPGERVVIDQVALGLLDRFVNTPSALIADHVRIDMSRKPFLSATSFSYSPDAVSKTESVDGERGVLTVTLENLSGIRTVLSALPRVRIGDGLEIIGTKRIVLRYWTAQDVDRPIFFNGVATGAASYVVEGTPNRRHGGTTVRIDAETRRAGTGYRFEQSVETSP